MIEGNQSGGENKKKKSCHNLVREDQFMPADMRKHVGFSRSAQNSALGSVTHKLDIYSSFTQTGLLNLFYTVELYRV